MIAIAGGTGRLGTQVAKLLAAQEQAVRILTRDPARASHLASPSAEVVQFDLHDASSLERGLAGVSTLISAIHGFAGRGADSPRSVDLEGNRALIQAAQQAGVEHFILISIHGVSADHPIELFRMKYGAEQALRASSLAWTIIRPTAYMELWIDIIGTPLIQTGKTRIFGRGRNPINFISVDDVARFVELAAQNSDLRGQIIEIGGPDNLSFERFAETVMSVSGAKGTVSHVPLPMMRVMGLVMRPINRSLARQIQAGIVMDTQPMAYDPSETSRRYPSIPLTRLSDAVLSEMSRLSA
jgi:uncharacterized protein YbjT (DUF2867 family)